MRSPILAGAFATAAVLLAGCANDAPLPAPVIPVAATAATPAPVCTRGAIDAQRVFILCPAATATADDAAMALKRPADLSLDLASIAADYGIARQSVAGLEAATYARIVGKTPETKPRTSSEGEIVDAVTINGREFRKVTLDAEQKKPAVLFVQK